MQARARAHVGRYTQRYAYTHRKVLIEKMLRFSVKRRQKQFGFTTLKAPLSTTRGVTHLAWCATLREGDHPKAFSTWLQDQQTSLRWFYLAPTIFVPGSCVRVPGQMLQGDGNYSSRLHRFHCRPV